MAAGKWGYREHDYAHHGQRVVGEHAFDDPEDQFG